MSFKLLDVGIDALRRVRIGRSALVVGAICVATAPSPSFAETPDAFLQYVQTGNEQFIDTGINAASGIKAEFNFRWLGYNGQGRNNMLGAQTPSNSLSAHLLEYGGPHGNRRVSGRRPDRRWYVRARPRRG